MKLLKQADFSIETDLKERLRKQLFGDASMSSYSRQALDDEDAALIFAAGDTASAAEQANAAKKSGLLQPTPKNTL